MLSRILSFLVLGCSTLANAADLFLTPSGSGKKDGASWEHALDQASLSSAVNEIMKPGDRLLLGGGDYPDAALNITVGGSEGQPKTIAGVDRGAGLPVFSAAWNIERPDKGRTAVRIAPGVAHVALLRVRMKGYTFGVHAPPADGAAPRSHLVFDDVDMEQIRHGFYLADCDDVRIAACDLKRYTKHGFRLDQGCDRVTLRQCVADCSAGDAEWETKTELFPFGFVVNDGGAPNTALVFEDCLARNNMMPLQKTRYKNGDGFVVEADSTDVTFARCRAIRNQDGGFDLKVRDVRLTDCAAIGNSRGFRIWTTGTLTNCVAGWGGSGLWCNGGPVAATRCTFHAPRVAAVMTDDRATLPVTLTDCIISLVADAGMPHRKTAHGEIALSATVVTGPSRAEQDPGYLRPDAQWDGLGDAMDSRTYPDKGYRNRVEKRP